MRLLAVVSKLTGVSTTVESSAVTLNAPSIVKLSVAREEISQLTRINQDLVVRLHSGETITIKNFYVTNDLGASQLVLAENDGTLWWVENPQAGLHFEQIADINELMVTSGASHEAGGCRLAVGTGWCGGGWRHCRYRVFRRRRFPPSFGWR